MYQDLKNFRMVDIEINTWSPLFLHLQINGPIGIKDFPFLSFQLRAENSCNRGIEINA